MGRLVGPDEKRAPAPLSRSLATQTLSCPNRSFRCKARPNQCHAPQVGLFSTGSSWPISCVRRTPGSSPASPRNSPWQAITRRPQYVREGLPRRRALTPNTMWSITIRRSGGSASVTGASCHYCCERWEGHWGRVQRMHAPACCSGELSVHAKAFEGLRSLRATTYHLLRNLTCRDYLRAWVRVRARPRT